MLRIALLIATNIAVVLLASVTLSLLGVDQWLAANGVGMNLGGILLFCSLIGFGGAFVSLMLSKTMARMAMRVRVIDTPASAGERWLVETVADLARAAGIKTPQVGIFESPQPNAFATGWNKDDALVAVSSGLLAHMNQDEVRAVLGHEIGHAANGDMVTLSLVQGVTNTFVMFLAWIVGNLVDRLVFRNERGYGVGFWITRYAAQIVFGIVAGMVVAWFSRYREFRADAAGARLAGRHNMIAALEALQRAPGTADSLPPEFSAFGINGGGIRQGLARLMATHPPLEERIAALRNPG